MTPEIIVQLIGGQALYDEACRGARHAAITSNDSTAPSFSSEIPHDISDLVWESSIPTGEKLHLMLHFYEQMPCYAYLIYLKGCYDRFPTEERVVFWIWVRQILNGEDDALSFPITYSLWCDFFEDPRTVEEAWHSLISPLPSTKALEKILIHSGPVPFELKQPLYATLLPDHTWHYFIYRSLLHSAFDVYGKMDPQKAVDLLNRLDLASNTLHLDKLRKRLGI